MKTTIKKILGFTLLFISSITASTHASQYTDGDIYASKKNVKIVDQAKFFSTKTGELAQFYAICISVGSTEKEAISLLMDFNGNLEKPVLVNFKELREKHGLLQSMLSFLSSASEKNGNERYTMIQKGFKTKSSFAMELVSVMENVHNLQQLFTKVTGQTIETKELTDKIEQRYESSRKILKEHAANQINSLFQ